MIFAFWNYDEIIEVFQKKNMRETITNSLISVHMDL